MLRSSNLHIGATFVTIRNTNWIYYYHTVDFFRRFNAYGSVNVFLYLRNRYRTETDIALVQLHVATVCLQESTICTTITHILHSKTWFIHSKGEFCTETIEVFVNNTNLTFLSFLHKIRIQVY